MKNMSIKNLLLNIILQFLISFLFRSNLAVLSFRVGGNIRVGNVENNGTNEATPGKFSELVSAIARSSFHQIRENEYEDDSTDEISSFFSPSDMTQVSNPLELAQLKEKMCKILTQSIVVVDAGSTKTTANLYKAPVEMCPNTGASVIEDKITFVSEGIVGPGVRDALEKWLNEYAGEGWESRAFRAKPLQEYFPAMQKKAYDMTTTILTDVVRIIEESLTDMERRETKALGVPVIFQSTAGIRGFHDWYRDGFLLGVRAVINSFQHEGYSFFTTPELCRAISGKEEGVYAFMTANQMLRRFEKLKHETTGPKTHKELVGIVEVGGASLQIVIPVKPYSIHPAFIRVTSLIEEKFIPETWPDIQALAVSFMQLGATSASGLFLKNLCSKQEFLINGVCHNPCLPQDFEHECSAGEITVDTNGIHVATSLMKNKLKPAATFCSGNNKEIALKATNRIQCLANEINPDLPLEERLKFKGCNIIKGTGNFEKCLREVKSILINPTLPLPANQEASSVGFDNPSQIFKFMSTESTIYITGKALVEPIMALKKLNLLEEDYKGDVEPLKEAATHYCKLGIKKKDHLFYLDVPDVAIKIDGITCDFCQKLAVAVSLLEDIYSGEKKPKAVFFQKRIADPETGVDVGEFGWQVGTLLANVINRKKWSRIAYELGSAFVVRDKLK